MLVVVTSLFLAMKLEEKKTHSLNSILSILKEEEWVYITRENVLSTEMTLLELYDFDFQVISAFNLLPRFL